MQYLQVTILDRKEWAWAEGIWESFTFSIIMLAVFGRRIVALFETTNANNNHLEEDLDTTKNNSTINPPKKLIYFDSIGNAAIAYLISGLTVAKDRILEGYHEIEFPAFLIISPFVVAVGMYVATLLWRMRKLKRGTLDVEYYGKIDGKLYTANSHIYSVLLGLGAALSVVPLLDVAPWHIAIPICVGVAVYTIAYISITAMFGKVTQAL